MRNTCNRQGDHRSAGLRFKHPVQILPCVCVGERSTELTSPFSVSHILLESNTANNHHFLLSRSFAGRHEGSWRLCRSSGAISDPFHQERSFALHDCPGNLLPLDMSFAGSTEAYLCLVEAEDTQFSLQKIRNKYFLLFFSAIGKTKKQH